MSRTAECLGLLALVGRWNVDRLMVVYMNGVVSCGCVGALGNSENAKCWFDCTVIQVIRPISN